MIIYHAITAFHVMEFWLHKLLFHHDDQATILVPDFIKVKYPDFEKKVPKDVFCKVCYIKYARIGNGDLDRWTERQMGLTLDLRSIKKADKIYVGGAQYPFSHWLIIHKIPFVFFEEAVGLLSKPEMLMNNVKKLDMRQHEMALADGMYTGDNPLVEKIICDLEAQINGQYDNRAEDFNVVNALAKISDYEREELLSFFNAPKGLSFSKDSAIILTQHFANIRRMSLEKQAVLYQMTVDYYLDGYELYFKPNPDDLLYYELLFNGSVVFHENFPSELLPYISANNANMIATISSTRVHYLKKCYERWVCFNQEYETSFIDNHKYYFAGRLIEILHDHKIESDGINDVQMRNMLLLGGFDVDIADYNRSTNDRKATVYLVGSASPSVCERIIQNTNDEDVVFFFNNDGKYNFYKSFQHDLFNFVIPKEIRVSAIDQDECRDVSHEYVYVFTRSKGIREKVKKMHYVKELINSGIEVKVPESMDKDLQIAALKGMLDATEKRLLHYIKKENETEQIHK